MECLLYIYVFPLAVLCLLCLMFLVFSSFNRLAFGRMCSLLVIHLRGEENKLFLTVL